MTDKDYQLFPELSKEAQEEAQKLIEKFKFELSKVAEDTISHFYTDVTLYIESDSWTNFRNELMDGLTNYRNKKISGMYEFKKIRERIFNEFRNEIIDDLNQDLIEKVEELESQVAYFRDFLKSRLV